MGAEEPRDSGGIGCERARSTLALALDVGSAQDALRLAEELGEYFGVMKVGLELFTSAGPGVVADLVERGFEVFLDLKLHDIPNTVQRASHAAREAGATWLTVHSCGGEAMVSAAVSGFGAPGGERSSSPRVGQHPPAPRAWGPPERGVLGVTVLTSETVSGAGLVAERARIAHAAGCSGVICAGGDVPSLVEAVPGIRCVVPGVRMPGGDLGDQRRVTTPVEALVAGASMLVVGRAVTSAADPVAAAKELFAPICALAGDGGAQLM